MRIKKIWVPLLLVLVFATAFRAEAGESRVALLDLDVQDQGTEGSYTFALRQALEVAGVPYTVTTSPQDAASCPIIVSSTKLLPETLSDAEISLLAGYVEAGGILVVPEVQDSRLFNLFGISAQVSADTRYTMTWDTDSGDNELHWFEDAAEITISLGSASQVHVVTTTGYTTAGASTLARFDDGSAAVTRNSSGTGLAYALGFSFKDLILRNELNYDFDAQRSYSNGFEPTSDTVMLFLRAVYESAIPFAVYKHTSPDTSRAALIITHDVDARTSMDMMGQFASMEKTRGLHATYNVTAHYFRDDLSSNYYTDNVTKVAALLSFGQKIGSHTVGHFPDWADESVFPIGSPGETRDSYHPAFACPDSNDPNCVNDGATTGGTVFAEAEVSRKVLEQDTGALVKTFRSGYLYWNQAQINVLDALGYRYDSSMSANDVLTNFPYRCRYDTSYHGTISNIFEIPMTISDAAMSAADTCPAIVANWSQVIEQNAKNGAPTVLLIHPNRDYKLAAEQSLLDGLPAGVTIIDMDSFGDFWRARENLKFTTDIEAGNRLVITIARSSLPIGRGVSLIVRGGKSLSGITVQTEDGGRLAFASQARQENDLILHSIGPDFDRLFPAIMLLVGS